MSGPYNPQENSPIFQLPGEIRNLIFYYSLLPCDDLTREYERDTCYKRPEQNTKRRIHVDLLRTCKAVHSEAWFLPWSNADHFLYLTADVRKPPNATLIEKLGKMAETMHKFRGESITSHIYVYAQCAFLEQGSLNNVLELKHLSPTTITLTLRHTDWWYWETDTELYVRGGWVPRCRFPNSLQKFCICFESLKRKTGQVQQVAAQAKDEWFFRKQDGTPLSAQGSDSTTTRWTGSSIWNGRRWIRDETGFKEIEYYCETVTWTPTVDWPGDEQMSDIWELRGGRGIQQYSMYPMMPLASLAKQGLMDATADEIRQALVNRPSLVEGTLYD